MALESLVAGVVLGLYFPVLAAMAVYGLHRLALLRLFLRHRNRPLEPPRKLEELPSLTVQIPLYNEPNVAARAVEAACDLDYPRNLFEVQVLDDSTDDTPEIVREVVARRRADGIDVAHIRRGTRQGFKAGALAAGLACARGELVAVFDADFVPPPDFARRLADHFADPRVGMVQARWGHLNREHSVLTRVQALLLDGHFWIEHLARNRSGLFFNFNGTAGIWRRRAIEDAGGWAHDTLCEDLDLSYRAQLRGWKFVYVPEVVAPAELPVEMGAFKSQQHRWAKGAVQTALKLLPTILRSPIPRRVKVEAAFHLTAHSGYVLMLLLAVLVGPAVWLRRGTSGWWIAAVDLPLFALTTLSVGLFYAAAYRAETGGRGGGWRWVPVLMSVGVGLCLASSRAVLEALLGRGTTEFVRTPKYGLGPRGRLRGRRRRAGVRVETWVEAAFALYFCGLLGAAGVGGLWAALPFLLLFASGFAYTTALTLLQARGAGTPALE